MSDILPTVSLVDGVPMVSSFEVAERFGKTHKAVLRAIQNLIADLDDDFHRRNFALMSRKVKIGNGAEREEPYYNLTRDAFSLLAMGFTGKKALVWKVKYIEAFNLMEARLLKQAEGKNPLGCQQKALPRQDKYEAYLEAVEDFRADTARRIDALLNQGLALLDTRRLGPAMIIGFTPILIDWLQRIAGQHAPLISPRESPNRAIDYSPLYLIRYMEKMAVSQ